VSPGLGPLDTLEKGRCLAGCPAKDSALVQGKDVLTQFPNLGGFSASGPIYLDLAVLFVGWALGILSSPITDAIRRRSVKRRITRAVGTELRSLQDTFANVVIQVSRRRGVLTHSLLEALMSTLVTSGQTTATSRAAKLIDELLNAGEAALKLAPDRRGLRTSLSLRVLGVPFLESHLHRLDFYSHETQRQLLEIRAGSQIFNQHAEEAMRYHFMTFGEGVGTDHLSALIANVEKCYERAAEKASELVSQIAVLLQNPEMRRS
jgi:hypothetical protein